MLRALYTNCFLPASIQADVVLTDERAVADAVRAERGIPVLCPEEVVAPGAAHAQSIEMWRLAYSWFRAGNEDDSVTAGISAGDLAGLESALTVIGPVTRATLSMTAILDTGFEPTTLVSVTPAETPGGARYERLEHLAAEAVIGATLDRRGSKVTIEHHRSSDPRNAALRDKYARTRDPAVLLTRDASRAWRETLVRGANLVAHVRRRRSRSLLVVEYNPTLAFSRGYTASPVGRRRLVRFINDPREIPPAVWAGDLVAPVPRASRRRPRESVARRLQARGDDLAGSAFSVAGVSLWRLMRPRLLGLVYDYADFAAAQAPRLRRQLARWNVEAVLVPYDNNPPVRLLVRVAQSLDIPTFVLNDGYKAEEIQLEGMSTDVALPWSTAIRDNYFVRHPGRVIVTGNPKLASIATATWRGLDRPRPRVLVGSFTFSAIDFNCRRSDPERFLDGILEGIAMALPAVSSEVIVKLHPADEPAHYGEIVRRYPQLRVDLRTRGDVLELFDQCDIYVTTYSTSLLEAALSIPVVYYRVNEQRLGPPFDGDDYLGARTATTPPDLANLLRDRETLATRPPADWVERYLGPEGATERISDAIEAEITRRSRGGAPSAPGAARLD